MNIRRSYTAYFRYIFVLYAGSWGGIGRKKNKQTVVTWEESNHDGGKCVMTKPIRIEGFCRGLAPASN